MEEKFKEAFALKRAASAETWIASRSVLRQKDMAFKQHFEFEDEDRWRISPATMGRQFEVLVGDAFDIL